MSSFQSPWSNSSQPTSGGSGFQSPWSNPPASNSSQNTPHSSFIPLTASDINGSGGAADSGAPSPGGGGFFQNMWSGIMNGYDYTKGALSGVGNALTGNNDPHQQQGMGRLNQVAGDLTHWDQMLQHNLEALKNIPEAIFGGVTHPTEATQQFNQGVKNDSTVLPPGIKQLFQLGIGSANDPLMYAPLGKAAQLIKAGADAAHITPLVTKAADAVKASKIVQNPLVQGAKDKIGSMFVKNFGVSPEVSQGLQRLEGTHAADKMAIQNHLVQLAKQHGLTPSEIKQLPEVFQAKGSTNPKLQQAYIDLNHAINNGVPLHDNFNIGTHAETSTHFNGNPILDPQKLMKDVGYYPQRYGKDLNPKLQAKLESIIPQTNEKGFSTSGPFGQERQFKTVAEAEANGFNPERNAYAATAQRLAESAKALRTANFLQSMIDKGVISKEAAAGMKASDIKPVSSFHTIIEGKPKGTSPLSQANNESGAVFKPLTKLDDSGFKLPNDLSKSSPRYRSNPLNFQSDMDKAAYIIGNTGTRSARDADFVKSLTDHTGLSESELRTYGQHMRNTVKSLGTSAKDGEAISVPKTLSNLPEHSSNPLSAGNHTDPNGFDSLVKSLEEASPADKVVKVNPFYVKPKDETAIKEYLDPSKPSGVFGAANKLNNLYNKGFLLNPLPHMHNVTTNGMLLGEANPSYIKEAFNNIKNGASDPHYEQAVRAGAVSGMRGGNLMKSVNDAMAPEKGLAGKALDKFNYARHDALWDTDSAIRTALFRQAKESGMSDAAAAAHTNKFMVDYNNITPFEKKFIKPVVPFYAWKKGNIPLQASQMIAQTPKYEAYGHLKDAVSQGVSGQPTDKKGRIMNGEVLPNGDQVALDPYSPMDEPHKISEKGPIPWLLNSINPVWKEAGAQVSSALGAFAPSVGIQNKYPIYNDQSPADKNIRTGVAHALNALNPLSGSAIAGSIDNPSKLINSGVNAVADHLGGSSVNDITTKDKPGQTPSEVITKLFGGFSGRDNPGKDATNQAFQQRDDAKSRIKYLRSTGQPIPRSLTKAAYKKIPLTK